MSDYACDDCQGTGMDFADTAEARERGECDSRSYIRCWTCNGNGLDPAKFFRWSSDAQKD